MYLTKASQSGMKLIPVDSAQPHESPATSSHGLWTTRPERGATVQDTLVVVDDRLARFEMKLHSANRIVDFCRKGNQGSVEVTGHPRIEVQWSHRAFMKSDTRDFVVSIDGDDRTMRKEMNVLALIDKFGSMTNERHTRFGEQIEDVGVLFEKVGRDAKPVDED